MRKWKRNNVTGLEADSILEFNGGEYATIEVKLGFGEIKDYIKMQNVTLILQKVIP